MFNYTTLHTLSILFLIYVFNFANFYFVLIVIRCYLKLGQWQENLQGTNENSIPTILQYYASATDHDTAWYKAWHSWAYMNFETVLFYKQLKSDNLPQASATTTSVNDSQV